MSRSSVWLLSATSVFVAVGCGGATNGNTRDGNGNGAGTGTGGSGGGFKPMPPAPGCPAVLPSAGSSCTGNLACPYPSPTSMSICDPQPYAECFNGTWQISQVVMATDCGWMEPPHPPQTCPAIPPKAGSPCMGQAYCEYRNPAESCPPFYSLSCGDNGTWLYGGPLILCDPPGGAGAGPGPSWGGEGPSEGGYGPVVGAGGDAGASVTQGGVGGAP